MSSEMQKMKSPTKIRIWILIGLCIFAGLLWSANWYFVVQHFHDDAKEGHFGEMFGAVNSLFTALAFAGLIYTVMLQRQQLALQQQEIFESGETQRQLVERQIAAQQELFERQKKFQEEQRSLQNQHALKIEELRQNFEGILEQRRKDHDQEQENKFEQNVLRAIRCEIEVLRTIYNSSIGAQLAATKQGEPFLVRLSATEDWFTVFNANAAHLGKIDGELSRRIITLYLLRKRMIEEFQVNNTYMARLEKIELDLRVEPASIFFLETKKQLLELMKTQAEKLKECARELKVIVAELLDQFDKHNIR
jgi:hypothetical protein